MFLALDTVFGQCSVALITDQGEILVNEIKKGNREQTQQILPMLDAALTCSGVTLSDLTALIFNRGPGAFSGIRINTAVVQALSVAHDIPCVGISSLQVLAQAAYEQSSKAQSSDAYHIEHCYAVHDARMKQVYLGEFECREGLMQPTSSDGESAERLVDYNDSTPLNLPLVGDGATLLRPQQGQVLIEALQLDGAILARLGLAQFRQSGGVPAEQALPVYLRNHAWKTLKEQGKAL